MARPGAMTVRTTPADVSGMRAIQLLLGATLLVGSVLAMLFGAARELDFFIAGVALAFVATGAAIALPWHRFPLWVSSVLPMLDILAIGLLREASPDAGFALLWVFPAMWAAWVWALPGAVGATVLISGLYWGSTILLDAAQFTPAAILLPVTVAAAAALAHTYAMRTSATRGLLERQSEALRAAVERATREEALIAEVLDAVDFGVARVDAGGQVLMANASSTAMLRLRQDAGEAVFAADGLTRIDPMATPNLRAQRGERFEDELAWYGEAGDERRALRTTSRRLGAPERGEGLIITQDVTEEQLALRARNDLVSAVSHELRTPLTSILGYLDLVLDDPALPETIRPNLQVAERNAERLLELVTEILSGPAFSRTGIDIRIHPVSFELLPLIDERLEELAPRIAEAGLTIDRAGVEPATVFGDPKRLAQVVENLLTNAIKYNSEHGTIELGLTSDGQHTWFIVRDRGAGISPSELPHIFDRFFRSETVRNTSTHGHGLGLAISRNIVRAHGGEITVQSEVGVGSTFVVRLPTHDPRGE